MVRVFFAPFFLMDSERGKMCGGIQGCIHFFSFIQMLCCAPSGWVAHPQWAMQQNSGLHRNLKMSVCSFSPERSCRQFGPFNPRCSILASVFPYFLYWVSWIPGFAHQFIRQFSGKSQSPFLSRVGFGRVWKVRRNDFEMELKWVQPCTQHSLLCKHDRDRERSRPKMMKRRRPCFATHKKGTRRCIISIMSAIPPHVPNFVGSIRQVHEVKINTFFVCW